MLNPVPLDAALNASPEDFWRASCVVLGAGNEDQSEWLHEMAVELIDIQALPTFDRTAALTPLDVARQLGWHDPSEQSDEFDLF